MYLEQKICYCGFPWYHHPYKHKYEPFTIYYNIEENFYNINAEDFVHLYNKDKNIEYRKINFAVPEDAVCHKKNCRLPLFHHKNISHPFTIKVEIANKNKNDLINIFHPYNKSIKIDSKIKLLR